MTLKRHDSESRLERDACKSELANPRFIGVCGHALRVFSAPNFASASRADRVQTSCSASSATRTLRAKTVPERRRSATAEHTAPRCCPAKLALIDLNIGSTNQAINTG
jgi:hypothetical protein